MMRRPPPVKSSTVLFLAVLVLIAPNMAPWLATALAGVLLFLAIALLLGGE